MAMGLRAVTDPGMSFPPTHPPAWWEHQRPEPLLQGWSCWWEGRATGEPARAVGLDPRCPSPALAWPCKRRDRVGGRSQQPPPYHAAGPSVCPHQPSPDADSDPIYPRVTGYEPLSEGPGHPCLQGAQLTGCPPIGESGRCGVQHRGLPAAREGGGGHLGGAHPAHSPLKVQGHEPGGTGVKLRPGEPSPSGHV